MFFLLMGKQNSLANPENRELCSNLRDKRQKKIHNSIRLIELSKKKKVPRTSKWHFVLYSPKKSPRNDKRSKCFFRPHIRKERYCFSLYSIKQTEIQTFKKKMLMVLRTTLFDFDDLDQEKREKHASWMYICAKVQYEYSKHFYHNRERSFW